MKYCNLSDVAKIIMGQSPPSITYNTICEGLPFFQGKADFGDLYPSVRYYCSKPIRIAEPGDILISVRAPVGPTNLNREYSCIGRGLSAIRVGDKVSRNYLFYFLRYYEPELIKAGIGSTFEAISRDDIETVKIPFKALAEQKRIAELLEQADQLRLNKRFARQFGETFLQSVFMEMFGDLYRNPKGWKVEIVGEHITSIRYGTGSPPDYKKMGIPFIRATNVKQGTIKKEGLVYISEEDAKKISKCRLNVGDLIVVRSGINSGDCGLIPPEYNGAYAAYDLIVEVPYPTNYFINFIINSPYGKALIDTLSRRAGQPHVNAEQIEFMKFPFPPLQEQEFFAAVVRHYEHLHAIQYEAERQAEGLFQALLGRAFGKEL